MGFFLLLIPLPCSSIHFYFTVNQIEKEIKRERKNMGNCELQCKWSMGWLSGEEIVRERERK